MVINFSNIKIQKNNWFNLNKQDSKTIMPQGVKTNCAEYSPAFYYPVSFGARNICTGLNLFKIGDSCELQKVPVKVSMLTKRSSLDREKMQNLESDWSETKLGDLIASTFLEEPESVVSTFLLEDDKAGSNKIYSAATAVYSSSAPDAICSVEYLQSAPDVLENKDIKGSGELLLYAIVKDAQKRKAGSIVLYPYDEVFSFYKHIGFHSMPYEGAYGLNSNEFDKFLKKVEKRYSIKRQVCDNKAILGKKQQQVSA